jgi:hypothetical protein
MFLPYCESQDGVAIVVPIYDIVCKHQHTIKPTYSQSRNGWWILNNDMMGTSFEK